MDSPATALMRKTLLESRAGDFWVWKVRNWPAHIVAEKYDELVKSRNHISKEKP